MQNIFKSHRFIFEFLFMIPFHHIIIIQLSTCDKQINNPQKAIHKREHNIFVIVNRILTSQFLFEFFF